VPSDKDGSADPFVQLYQYGNYTRTSVFPKTLNPSWNQRLVCPGTVLNGEFPPIILTVTDHDESIIETNPHDYMGQVVVDLTQLHVYNGLKEIKDSMVKKWHTIRYNKKFNKGKIYCGFCIVK
jgi:Ca2+-dependent lipid-binding protein